MTEADRRRVALVTGASTGIGRQTGALLARSGYRVFGTSRQPARDTLDGFELLPLDVTSDESVRACVRAVIERAGRLDVLVNNAGVDMLGGAEETTLDEAKWLFEINFFGVMRMVQAVLPHMRRQRGGVIINISSLAGLGGAPFQGLYSASKSALESYTESLMYEVQPFGLRVALVEPGFFRSEIGDRMPALTNPIADYDADRRRLYAGWERLYRNSPDPAPVAQTVLAIAGGRSKRLRHLVGAETALANWKLVVPEWVAQQRVRRMFGLDNGLTRALRTLPLVGALALAALAARLKRRNR